METKIVQLSKNRRIKIVGKGEIKRYDLEEYSKECQYDDVPVWHAIFDTFNENVLFEKYKISKPKQDEVRKG